MFSSLDISIGFLLMALLAEVVGTIGGFGSSVFFVPMAGFYLDFHSVLGLTALLHVASNASKLALFRKGLDRKLIVYIGVPSVIFVILGGWLTQYIDTGALKIVLAIFLIAFSLFFLIRKNIVIQPNKTNAAAGGIFSGFSAGLLGTGGAIRGLTMASFNLEKSVFVATSAFIDLLIDTTRTVVYYQNGYIKKEEWVYVPFLLAVAIVGSYIGKKILERMPQHYFRRFSLVLILLIGTLMLFQIDA
ncbi:putative membrane transporter protein [Flavobacterium longum]|uniref:sulfite exporter TauE/SafE family protein n=1 Tax=Flavobacterium longum TaxID=1299340 RepID=UPI0039E8033E